MKNSSPKTVDPILLILIGVLVVLGFFIFTSASLGLLARNGASFGSVAFSQFFFGIVGGGLALLITSHIYYRHWRKYAFYIFVASILFTLAVFIPGIGMSHGGATRWLDLGITTVQPSEFLKVGFVIYVATLLSGLHKQIDSWRYGVLPFVAAVGIVGLVMLSLPDTDTFFLMALSGMAMFLTAGANWKHIGVMALGGLILITIVVSMRPYLIDRLTVFLHPEADPLGSGYQIQQSLIAVGSGEVTGRGYGQSIQKFEYLPEPIGDSIFAVYAEEFGFIGSLLLISILALFTFRGFKIATQTNDLFGVLLVVGFMTLIVSQAFLNIAAMIGLFPLAGLPLPLISHGGTAMLVTLAVLGIVLNVSKYRISKSRV
ncbi:MAG: cell division protein FtsW [Candidatus Nomurabacteria bacterium]|nr:MAG: cell division protein FtsW [Candidatus Nomurabacteria bacterium]